MLESQRLFGIVVKPKKGGLLVKKLLSLIALVFVFTSSFMYAEEKSAVASDVASQVESSDKALSTEVVKSQPEKAHPDFDWKPKPKKVHKKTNVKAALKAKAKEDTKKADAQVKSTEDVTSTETAGKSAE